MNVMTVTAGRQVSQGRKAVGIASAALGLGIAALLARGAPAPATPRARTDGVLRHAADALTGQRRSREAAATLQAARRLNRAAGLLAFSVLADSAIEHYRGSFFNKAMVTPLVVGSTALGVSLHGLSDRRAGEHRLRTAVYVAAALTGIIGSGFHLYNVLKRPGGLSWQSLFYGAPLGAPAATLLSGLFGAAAERMRDTMPGSPPRVLGAPAGRAIAAVTSLGLLGTVGEAALLHFRGAFHDPVMFAPVTLPPGAALLMARQALAPTRRHHPLTRGWLWLTAALGFAGVGFHAYGVSRAMGGWRNWRQTVIDGPPLPAPPSFTGLALAGLAALALLEDHPDA
jgi:hypothetical protein